MQRRQRLWPLLIALLAIGPASAQEPTASAANAAETAGPSGPVRVLATAEPKQATLGQPIRYTVEARASVDVELRIPVLAGEIGPFSIIDFGEIPPERSDKEVRVGRWYTLTAWQVGELRIPAPKMQYRVAGQDLVEVEGNEIAIEVKSLLAADPGEPELRDIRPPWQLPFDWRPYALLAGVLAVIGAIAAAFYYFVQRPRRQPIIPPRPAHEIALDGLQRLRGQKLVEAGRFEEYYVALSALVRRYLEDGFGLRAPEMTTEEFLLAASSDRRLAANHRRTLAEFLSQADLVKFARYQPGIDDAEGAYQAARRFVEETRPREESAEEKRHAAA